MSALNDHMLGRSRRRLQAALEPGETIVAFAPATAGASPIWFIGLGLAVFVAARLVLVDVWSIALLIGAIAGGAVNTLAQALGWVSYGVLARTTAGLVWATSPSGFLPLHAACRWPDDQLLRTRREANTVVTLDDLELALSHRAAAAPGLLSDGPTGRPER